MQVINKYNIIDLSELDLNLIYKGLLSIKNEIDTKEKFYNNKLIEEIEGVIA